MKKYIKIVSESYPELHLNPISQEDLLELSEMFKEAEVGEIFEIEIVKLTNREVEELGED